jgi:hypothetical protein
MVQLFEAFIYYNNNIIYSQLLLLNLGYQGLVFILLLNNYIPINKIYIFITAIIATIILYQTFDTKFANSTTDNGILWTIIVFIFCILCILLCF